MRRERAESTIPDLTFEKRGEDLVVTNNSESDSFLILVRTKASTAALTFKAGTTQIPLDGVLGVTSFRLVPAWMYDVIGSNQKPCDEDELCPIPPEPWPPIGNESDQGHVVSPG